MAIRKSQVYKNVSKINIAYHPGMWLTTLHMVSSVIPISKALKAVNCIPSFKDFSLLNPETFTTRKVLSCYNSHECTLYENTQQEGNICI